MADWAEYAWRGENVLNRFAQGLGAHLTSEARALLIVFTELDLLALKKEFKENEFEVREIRKRSILGERIYVYGYARLMGEGVRGESTSEAGQE
jgi:hypothetical protein